MDFAAGMEIDMLIMAAKAVASPENKKVDQILEIIVLYGCFQNTFGRSLYSKVLDNCNMTLNCYRVSQYRQRGLTQKYLDYRNRLSHLPASHTIL